MMVSISTVVSASWTDTYTVELGTLSKGTWNCKKSVKGIYCDQLAFIIDDLVEGFHAKNRESNQEQS